MYLESREQVELWIKQVKAGKTGLFLWQPFPFIRLSRRQSLHYESLISIPILEHPRQTIPILSQASQWPCQYDRSKNNSTYLRRVPAA